MYSSQPFGNKAKAVFKLADLQYYLPHIHKLNITTICVGNICITTLISLSPHFCRGQSIVVTLWEASAIQFLKAYEEKTGLGPIVLIITHAKINPSEGS